MKKSVQLLRLAMARPTRMNDTRVINEVVQ